MRGLDRFKLFVECVKLDGRNKTLRTKQARLVRVRNNRSLDTDGTPKSGNERSVPLSKAMMDSLAEHVGGDRKTGYVFATSTGSAIGLRNASRALDAIFVKAGVQRKGLGWHSFRRYRATALAKAGVPEAHRLAWMGHADVDIDNIYIDTDEAEYERAMVEKSATGSITDLSRGKK
jgi:integrase